ncbi:hypothetical protein EC973_007887, partial [Apophysomyces ossiformis]
LPTRPHYDWTPPEELLRRLPDLQADLFSNVLDEHVKRFLIDSYPPMQQARYQPPNAVPIAHTRFSKSQYRDDITLKNIQYQISAIFRPLDVLAMELLDTLSPEHLHGILAIVHDVRTLVMHTNVNQARNQLALKAINPSFTMSSLKLKYLHHACGFLSRPHRPTICHTTYSSLNTE